MTSMALSVPSEPEAPLDAMAWYAWEADESESNWLLTYVDVLSVILAIMVLLLGHMSVQQLEPAEVAQETAVVDPVISTHRDIPEPIIPEPIIPESIIPESIIPVPVTVEPEIPATPVVLEPESPGNLSTAEVTPPIAADRMDPAVAQTALDPVPVETTAVTDSPETRLITAIESRFQNEVKVVKQAEGLSLEIAEVILFDSAEAELLPEAEAVLSRIVSTLAEIGEADIAVEGHTDNRPIHSGRFASNWDLAAARANQVTRFLLSQGLTAERLRSISYGDTQPVADNSSPAGRAANRRVNLRVEFL